MPTSWIEELEGLGAGDLTVRAQAVSTTDQGRLYWAGFMPRKPVNSTKLDDVTALDFRPVADRREWNQRGRLLPKRTPPRRRVSMVPIEMYDLIGEDEINDLYARFNGNEQMIAEEIGLTVPDRVEAMTSGDYRRLELDMFESWLRGRITQRNPQTGETYQASFGIDSGRLQTAATAWDDPSVDAYEEHLAWFEDGLTTVGPGAGTALRLATLRAIQADAPDLIGGVRMTRSQLEARIADDIGVPFRFFVIEETVDLPTDGGIATASANVFEAEMVAYVPANMQVGYSAFAPVARAYQIARQIPQANVDVRGATVFYDEELTGRQARVEVQLNAMPVPDEQRVFTIDVGV